MQPFNQGMRWKGLLGNKESPALTQSRQKSKKFAPTRTQANSDLNKIKVVSTSRLNTSSDVDLVPNKQALQQKQSSTRNEPKEMKSPTRNNSDFTSAIKLRPSLSSNEELSSPTVLFKQLRKTIKTQQNIQNHNKALFSLDQQHLYIHQQMGRIKTDFMKLKQIFLSELARYQKEIDNIVKKVTQKLQEVLQACTALEQSGIRISFDGIRQSGKPNNFFQNQMETLNLSIIKKESSITDSKIQLKRFLGQQSAKIDKALQNKVHEVVGTKQFYEPAKTDRLQEKKTSPIRTLNAKTKSKKQFEKLFQAVNCLKNDIKDLNSFNVQMSKKQTPVSRK